MASTKVNSGQVYTWLETANAEQLQTVHAIVSARLSSRIGTSTGGSNSRGSLSSNRSQKGSAAPKKGSVRRIAHGTITLPKKVNNLYRAYQAALATWKGANPGLKVPERGNNPEIDTAYWLYRDEETKLLIKGNCLTEDRRAEAETRQLMPGQTEPAPRGASPEEHKAPTASLN